MRLFFGKLRVQKGKINETNISQHILTKVPEEWDGYDAIICETIYVNKVKIRTFTH